MSSRREFLGKAAGIAGLCFTGCGLLAPHVHAQGGGRRLVQVGGKRVKVIDVHAHAAVPEAMELAGQKVGVGTNRPDLVLPATLTQRLADMDAQGIDMEALSINAFWYGVDRDRAQKICQIQNEKLAELVAKTPDRFVAFASVALQFPDLAAQQLTDGVKKYGLKGAGIGGSVAGMELSDAKLNPFWAKVEELGVPVFIHPQGDAGTAPALLKDRLKGNGRIDNAIGYPLETTIALSKLIFDGTLDRYPKLKIIGAHGRLPALLCGALRSRLSHRGERLPGRQARPDQEGADRIPEADVLRHDGVHARRPAPSDRGSRRRPAHDRHRLPVPVDQDGRRPCARHAGPVRRGQGSDSRGQRGEDPRHGRLKTGV